MKEALFYSSIYTAKSKKVCLVIGHSGTWNNAKMIYLSDHQTTVSQFPMPKVTFIESAQYTLHILVQRFASFFPPYQ